MRAERGSVSIVAVAVVALVLVLVMGVTDVARVLIASARARTAADAAALAAAQELALPSGLDPAAVAGDYAARNGSTLVSCACSSDATEADVSVRVDVGPLLLAPGLRIVTEHARAVVDVPGAPP